MNLRTVINVARALRRTMHEPRTPLRDSDNYVCDRCMCPFWAHRSENWEMDSVFGFAHALPSQLRLPAMLRTLRSHVGAHDGHHRLEDQVNLRALVAAGWAARHIHGDFMRVMSVARAGERAPRRISNVYRKCARCDCEEHCHRTADWMSRVCCDRFVPQWAKSVGVRWWRKTKLLAQDEAAEDE